MNTSLPFIVPGNRKPPPWPGTTRDPRMIYSGRCRMLRPAACSSSSSSPLADVLYHFSHMRAGVPHTQVTEMLTWPRRFQASAPPRSCTWSPWGAWWSGSGRTGSRPPWRRPGRRWAGSAARWRCWWSGGRRPWRRAQGGGGGRVREMLRKDQNQAARSHGFRWQPLSK